LGQLQLGLFLGLLGLLLRCFGPLLQFARAVEPVDDASDQVNARRNEEDDAPLVARLVGDHVAGEQRTYDARNGGERVANSHQHTGMLGRNIQVINPVNEAPE